MRGRGKRKPYEPIEAADPESILAQIDRHIRWLEARQYAASGLKTRRGELIRFGRWCAERGVERPFDLNRTVIELYQRYLARRVKADGLPLSPKTQWLKLSYVATFCKWLARERLVLYDPAADLEMPRQGLSLPRAVLSQEEVERILAVPDTGTVLGLRDRAILETFYSTAIRRSELARLGLCDLDLGRGVLAVRHGKGNRDRFVPVGERAQAWIRRYLEESRPELAVYGDDGALFLSADGTALAPNWVGEMVRKAIDAAGVKKPGGCHLFRHTAATLMLEGGADIRFIQQLLGHAKLETTQIYTRVSIEQLKAVHQATHPGARLRSGGVRKTEGGVRDPGSGVREEEAGWPRILLDEEEEGDEEDLRLTLAAEEDSEDT